MQIERPRRRDQRGLTLVEIVFAVGLLLVVAAGFGAMATISVSTTKDAQPYFLAQDTALRVAERMRSEGFVTALDSWWRDAGVTKVTLNGAQWAIGGTAAYTEETTNLTQAAAQGRIRVPSDNSAMLRVRFVNENDYALLWNTTALDLDFDGDSGTDAGEDVNDQYSMLPVVIEVRWREAQGPDRVYQLKTVIPQRPSMDPNR